MHRRPADRTASFVNLASQGDPPYIVPDFEADDAVRARYDAVSRELINLTVARGIDAVREEHEILRGQFTLAAKKAEAAQRIATAAAHQARARYARLVPRQRTASGIVRPPTLFFDVILSLGAADKLYSEAIATAQAKRTADEDTRIAFAALERLKSKEDAALVIRELEIRRHFKGPNGRLELDADPRLHGIALQCAAIELERVEFTQRLAAGAVSDAELRDRTMAQEGSRFLDGDVRGLHALRERDARFGKLRYFTFIDRESRIWLLDYHDDLRLLLHVTFDVVYANDRYLIARSAMEGTLHAANRKHNRLSGPDPRAQIGIDPRLMSAISDFVARERTTL
jgi:hypothetical protein